MLSISSLIEFLLDLLRDDEAAAEFARDPQGMLARHGLEGVTAQDVCDAQPMLADVHGVSPRSHQQHDDDKGSGHQVRAEHHDAPQVHHHHHQHKDDDDPVREIHHVTKNYEVDRDVVVKHHHTTNNEYNEYNEYNYTDNSVTADEGATVIQDSFNEDNDGVDNKGGIINDSNVAGEDQDDVGNTEETTTIEDSFNEDNSETTEVEDSFNDESETSTDISDSGNETTTDVSASINDSYNADSSVTVEGDVLDGSDDAAA